MSTDPAFYSFQVPQSILNELGDLLTETHWKFCYKYGGGTQNNTSPCIRVNHNDTQPNPLNNYINDERIKKYGSNMIKAYQASFVYYHQQIPNTTKHNTQFCVCI